MKNILTGALLLALLTLTACGSPAPPEIPEEEALDGLCDLREAPPGQRGWMLDMEREVYDPSLTTFTYFVRNETGETVDFGEDYRIQRWAGEDWTGEDSADEDWVDLTPREDWGFTAIGYSLPHCGEIALTCTLDMYEEMPEPGYYRLVKPLGEADAHVAFQLGKSPYTAETPYGFVSLEELPENYRAYTASKDCVVFTSKSVRNPENAEVFLHKSGLGVSCQLRTVEDYGDGVPTVTDVIYENGHFLRRTRRGGVIVEQRFSYLVTDGRALYLSNGADWASGEKYGDQRVTLLPEGTPAEMIDAVGDDTESRLRASGIRYRVWSADGTRDAFLTAADSPTVFAVNCREPGEGSWGSLYDLQDWDGLETAVTGLSWREDNTLLLSCKTAEGGNSTLCFDPKTERLTTLELCGLPPAENDAIP